LFWVLVLISACAQDSQYDGLFTPMNNEISSQWRGTYTGTGRLTQQGLIDGEACTVELRIIDMGDNTVRILAYLIPDFPFSENGRLEGEATSITECRITRMDDLEYQCVEGGFLGSSPMMDGERHDASEQKKTESRFSADAVVHDKSRRM